MAAFFVGCADGGDGSNGGGPRDDAAMVDAIVFREDVGTTRPDGSIGLEDASTPRDGGGGRRDAAGPTCPPGEHACGAGCVRDLPNEPANGCRLGCGEPCPTPPMGMAACDMAGTCTWTCVPPFRRMGDACVCTPRTCAEVGYECGAPDDGCGGALDCGSCMAGAACMSGRCACTPDEHEPNDSNTMPTRRPGLNDADDPPDVLLTANLHSMRDEDWFAFPITDGTDFGNPRITVTLRNIPVGSDYELSAYYVCGDRTDNSTCARGVPDNEVGRGCAGGVTGSGPEEVEIETDCSRGLNSDDSGTLLVRVRAATWMGTCGPYEVVVRVR